LRAAACVKLKVELMALSSLGFTVISTQYQNHLLTTLGIIDRFKMFLTREFIYKILFDTTIEIKDNGDLWMIP
jgi:hypothetical protein